MTQIFPEVRTKMQDIGLLAIENNIVVPNVEDIHSVYLAIKFMYSSIKRRLRWSCYFLYRTHGKFLSNARRIMQSTFTIDDIIHYDRKEMDKKKIIKMIDEIIKQQKDTDIRFERNKEQSFIEGDTQLVAKYLIADVQQRWESEALVDNILDHLDTSAYSNKELSQILNTDKSTISRKLYQLKKNELVIPKFVEGRDRLYYITNCENSPWDLTREECRSESITRKVEILNKYVFPSIANVVTFLQYANMPVLRDVFDEDIQMLFFGINKKQIDEEDANFRKSVLDVEEPEEREKLLKQREKLYRFVIDGNNVFRRLIIPTLTPSTTEPSNFRYLLLDILQWEIYQLVSSQSPYMLNEATIAHNVLEPDLGRAAVWIKILSGQAWAHSRQTKFNPDSRPVLF